MRKIKLWLFKRGWINIHPDALVAPSASVHRTAIIYGGAWICDNVQIGPHCIIGSVAEYPNDRMRHSDTGEVIIGKGAVLHGHNTVDGAKEISTIIDQNCTLMKGAHVGHDAYLDERVTLSCGAKIGGFAHVEHDSTIGLNATVHQKSFIPRGSMIGAGSFYKGHHNEVYMVWVGSPARPIKQNTHLLDKLKFNENFNHDSDLPKG
jgi:UDP-N-acetylglucosamine acyltransferase